LYFLFPVLSFGQEKPESAPPELSLSGKSSFTINIGFLNQSSATVNNVSTSANTNFLGSLIYNYWVAENWALELHTEVLGAEVNSGVSIAGIEQSSATIIPFLAGFRYYPDEFRLGKVVRPYLLALIGAYNGYSSTNEVLFGAKVGSESQSQSAFGSKLGIGLDAFVNRWARLGLNAGYNLVSDFKDPVGSRKNYSGSEFSFSFGIMF
jgi:outer membrane protein W